MFGSPKIQNPATDLSPIQAHKAGVHTLPFTGHDRSVHLTLKKQRLGDHIEASSKMLRIPNEDELVDNSAAMNERESLQMTPKRFKNDAYFKVDRGSTGRKRGYLKASTESKKNLVSLFNTGATRPLPLTGSVEKDPGHNIDQIVRQPSPAFSLRHRKPYNLFKDYPRDNSGGLPAKRDPSKSETPSQSVTPMVHIVLPGSMFAQSPHLNFLSNNFVMDPRNNRNALQQMLAQSDSLALACQQIHRQMASLCQSSADADFIDQQNQRLSRLLENSKDFMRSITLSESSNAATSARWQTSPLTFKTDAQTGPVKPFMSSQPDSQGSAGWCAPMGMQEPMIDLQATGCTQQFQCPQSAMTQDNLKCGGLSNLNISEEQLVRPFSNFKETSQATLAASAQCLDQTENCTAGQVMMPAPQAPASASTSTVKHLPLPRPTNPQAVLAKAKSAVDPATASGLQLRRAKKALQKEKQAREMGMKARENAERRRRNRKDADTMAALQSEYDKVTRQNLPWTKDSCKEVAARVGLSVSQVYKWGWDQRKKEAQMQQMVQETDDIHG